MIHSSAVHDITVSAKAVRPGSLLGNRVAPELEIVSPGEEVQLRSYVADRETLPGTYEGSTRCSPSLQYTSWGLQYTTWGLQYTTWGLWLQQGRDTEGYNMWQMEKGG
jgi:hypothetical protein